MAAIVVCPDNTRLYWMNMKLANNQGRKQKLRCVRKQARPEDSLSKAILSLPLIQEGQLSVIGERMCT